MRPATGAPAKSSNLPLLILVGLGVVMLLAVLTICIIAAVGFNPSMGSGAGTLVETFVSGSASASDRIVIVPIEGVIMGGGQGGFGPSVDMVQLTLERLDRAVESKAKAVILEINSPGGGVTASERLYRRIRRLRDEQGIPVIAHMKDVAASGGYYVAAPCNWIVAAPSTITASIGVIISHYDLQGLLGDKLGVRMEPFKSAPQKDILSMFRDPSPTERAHIQSIVDIMYGRFVEVVVAGRAHAGVTESDVRGLESTILIGQQAMERHLVDQLGFHDDAVAKAKELAGVSSVKVVRHDLPPSPLQALLGAKSPPTATERLAERLASFSAPLSYLWTGF